MVDTSRRVDLTGNDVIVNALAFSPPGSIPTGGIAGNIVIDVNSVTPTVNATATGTVTFAMMASGMYCHTGAAATLTFDSAANVVAGLNNSYSGATVGSEIMFDITSTSGVTTLNMGAGGTLSTGSTATVAAASQRTYILRVTNVTTPAYTVYS